MATSWLEKILPQIRKSKDRKASQVPEGLWRKCSACEAILYRPELERSLDVCPKCDHHLRVTARRRLELFLDSNDALTWIGESFAQRDPLKFKDSKKYKDRLQQAEKASQTSEALVVAEGKLLGATVVVAAFEFRFMGGSMGTAVGSRFVAGVKRAIELRVPFICFSASGGARMQEAVLSLMQMAKVSAALEQLALAKLPYISIMTDPVYGGVSASLAMLGDINMAEPNALIGFTGPRVIEQTVRQKLPEGFQRSEFLLAHGSIDMIVHRHDMRETVGRLLAKFQGAVDVQHASDLAVEVVAEVVSESSPVQEMDGAEADAAQPNNEKEAARVIACEDVVSDEVEAGVNHQREEGQSRVSSKELSKELSKEELVLRTQVNKPEAKGKKETERGNAFGGHFGELQHAR